MRLADDTVVGHELLSRTTIEAFESPDHLFPLAQQHNMLTFVDLLCLDTCLAEAHKFSPSGFYHVNLFPSTVMNTSIERLVSALGALTPSQVCLEITEQQFFGDSRQFTRRVQALRDAGFHVALDDVGFGRTSLELLMLLDVEFVKIDRRFVTGIGDDRTRAQALSRLLSVIALIGATAIVEGIETSDEQAALISLGVEYGQGFLWGRPHALGTTRST
jgi:EAL domain-containing protein (putative c-di-GMP-specific phosphodiesterase class I)